MRILKSQSNQYPTIWDISHISLSGVYRGRFLLKHNKGAARSVIW